jgi:polar amino acid transport system permease protein
LGDDELGEAAADPGILDVTRLAVLAVPAKSSDASAVTGFFSGWSLAIVVATFLLTLAAAPALAAPARASVVELLLKWMPLILFGPAGQFGGFALNILVSFLAMTIGTAFGLLLGIAQVSDSRTLRTASWAITQFFRNSPWLALLFFVTFLLPFEFTMLDVKVPMPGWLKATIGLSLPVMGNVSEIVRGAVRSVSATQWEAAEALAFSRRQTLWMVILPQTIKRMTPPWMNWYAILTMSTPLISIVGVADAMSLAQAALNAEKHEGLLLPMYAMLLCFFFLYCYPIARMTARLERRFNVTQ